MRIIKKYANRRLYDSATKAYINLDDLAGIVRAGADVQVIDAKSGDDLTQATLAQIILEGRGASKLLPVPLLTELVRMEEDALSEFFSTYMTWALEVYGQAKRGMAAATTINPLLGLPLEATKAMAKLFGGVVGWGERAPAPPVSVAPSAPPSPASSGEDVAELREELDELKAMIRALAKDG